jgi:hypothetical protein
MIKPKPTPTTAPATPRTTKRTKRTKLSDEQIRALRGREHFDPYSYGFTKLSALEGEGSW